MKKGQIIQNIEVEKLVFGGKGFTRLEDGKVAFITGGAIPKSVVDIKIIKKRKDYYETQIVNVVSKSPLETGNYEEFPGAPWINIGYDEQLRIKQNQIVEAMQKLQKYQEDMVFMPILEAPEIFGYRNKIEFSFGKYISHRDDISEHFNVGFHKRGEFSKVEDYDSCSLIDDEQNDIYTEIKNFCKKSGLPVYDQKNSEGFWRHLMIRKMSFSGEILIVLSVNPKYFDTRSEYEEVLNSIKRFFSTLVTKFSSVSSVYISHNDNKSDTLIGFLELIFGKEKIREVLLGLSFEIGPKSFFQTNSKGAEVLYRTVKSFAKRNQYETLGTVLDLYAGTGTIGMIFADISDEIVSVELVEEASKSGKLNADKNGIYNIEFINAKVEDFLDSYLKKSNQADLLIIDPPRAGMHPSALPNILKFDAKQIIYVSCNPATLVRDLEYILKESEYRIEKVQAVDMFPHTHHIEVVVSLTKKEA